MVIELAEPCLVMLIGPSGSGKSTFARRHFRASEVLSSDFCRALVCDNENDQSATDDAFDLLHIILAKRLKRRRTTVIDATNVQQASRASLLALGAQAGIAAIAIAFLLPVEVCQRRNRERAYRQVPGEVILSQIANLATSGSDLASEGFRSIHRITTELESDGVRLLRHS